MSTQTSYRYRVVDVFTRSPLEGNPLAVFPDGQALDDATMQRIAKELNLSETVFIFPPAHSENAASLRIFTPASEVPFAGHPTVGASFILLDEGTVPHGTQEFILEEKVGPVDIRVEQNDGQLIWLTTPPIGFGAKFDREACARALGLDLNSLHDVPPQIVSAGNPNLYIALKSKEDVDRASIDLAGLRRLKHSEADTFCVFVFTPTSEGAYSRMFAPEFGIVEDPATGSATGPLASYMLFHDFLPRKAGGRYISEQGKKMGRRSHLHIEVRGENGADGIGVGGYAVPLVDAVMKL